MEKAGLGLSERTRGVDGHNPSPTLHPIPVWLLVVAILVVCLLLGYVGFVLPAPGGSLLGPAGLVAAIGVLVAAIGGTYLFVRGARVQAGWFMSIVILLTAGASVWTFEFALPARMAWDASAPSQAQQALRQAQRGPVNAPCRVLRAGSIGPLGAPYNECPVTYASGFGSRVNIVRFTRLGTTTQGVAYTNIGPATFDDECYRHLAGDWWAFNGGDLSNPSDPCPFGYAFHGGG